MQRVVLLALAGGALGLAQASAEPIQLYPETTQTATRRGPSYRAPQPYPQAVSAEPRYYPDQRIYAEPRDAGELRGTVDPRYAEPRYGEPRYGEPSYNEPRSAPPQRYPAQAIRPMPAGRGVDLGGGFIEMLFSGDRPPPPPRALPRQASLGRPALREIDPIYLKQTVDYLGPEKPGTIIVDTQQRFLFLVQDNGIALRYGIGVGRPGFTWAGMKTITAKKEWPDWTPPKEMLERRPDLPTFMAGGVENPLGARALYLGSSLYRIHGSNEPWTIGQAVSSGCIRMRNEDVIDLYGKVGVGTKVRVI